MSTCARAASSVRVGFVARITSALVGLGAVVVIALAASPSTATFSGKNGRISFARSVDNHVEIFTANPDGSHIDAVDREQATGAVSFESDWSPDGQLIAFDSDRNDVDGRKHPVQIYVMACERHRGHAAHPRPRLSRHPGLVAERHEHGDRLRLGQALAERDLDHPRLRPRRRHRR